MVSWRLLPAHALGLALDSPDGAACTFRGANGEVLEILLLPARDERSDDRPLIVAVSSCAQASATPQTRARVCDRELEPSAAFWQRTEALFWRAFDAKVAGTDARAAFREGVARTALGLFEEATSVLGEPDGLARSARERAKLVSALRKKLDWPPARTERSA